MGDYLSFTDKKIWDSERTDNQMKDIFEQIVKPLFYSSFELYVLGFLWTFLWVPFFDNFHPTNNGEPDDLSIPHDHIYI